MQKIEEFLAAVRAGDAEGVARLVDEDPTLVSVSSGDVSAVLTAVYHGHAAIGHLLVERGAPVGFFEACALGDLDAVRRMLAADRSLLQARSRDGFAPVGFATFFGHPDIDRFLIEEGGDVRAHAENGLRVAPVHAAAEACDHGIMKLLLERGADPNARQQMDYTPLHTAAVRGDVAMATLLLDHGADREARGTDGKTPADVARERGKQTFADWLASYQAEA